MLDRWLYLDVGVFNGLMESIAGFGYEVCAERAGPTDLSRVSLLMLTLPMFSSLLAILFLGEALSALPGGGRADRGWLGADPDRARDGLNAPGRARRR
jgi:hypothetical protein